MQNSQPLKYFSQEKKEYYVKCISPINIALVKYWGKIHEEYIIPANSSISLTIDMEHIKSETVVSLVPSQEPEIEIFLNGKKDKVTDRIVNVINYVQKQAKIHQ